MYKLCGRTAKKVWATFVARRSDGARLKFRVEDLTEDCHDDFIDFVMEHYVPKEFQHIVSGLPKDLEGMAEYRDILASILKRPYYTKTVVYCDDGSAQEPALVSASSMRLRTSQTAEDELLHLKPQSKALQRYFQIAREWDSVYPIHEILRGYGIERYFDDQGGAVHRDYAGLGVAQMVLSVRRQICKEHGVPMTGAWMTSTGSQKAAARDGWSTACEVTALQLERALGLTFTNAPATFKYMICKL